MIQRWSIARKIMLGFALGPIALIVIGLISYTNTNRMLATQRIVANTYAVRNALHRVEIDLVNAESGQRGYLLTGKADYLKPYQQAQSAVGGSMDALDKAVAGEPQQEGRAATIRSLSNQKLAELAETLNFAHTRSLGAAIALVRSNRGESIMEQIRGQFNDALAEQRRIEQQRYADDARAAAWSLGVTIYGTLVIVVILCVAGVLLTRTVSGPLEEAVLALTSASAEILAGTTQQASGVQEQAAAVTETVATIEQISQTAESSNDRAKAVAESSLRAVDNGVAGRRAVDETVTVMGDVKTRTESIANSILALAEQAQAIGEIIAVVNNVADQTNILAFNAAIEASRAGEQGKGFGVVASEIKSLAEQSKKATVQVRQILGEIQRATNSAVIATEHGAKTVDEALHTVHQADEAIRALTDIVSDAARSATQISASANQQSIGMAQIQRAMRDISDTTAQSLASTRQTEQAARDLDAVGSRLAELLRGATA
jgi:methyl-accepting chemotaxis protein